MRCDSRNPRHSIFIAYLALVSFAMMWGMGSGQVTLAQDDVPVPRYVLRLYSSPCLTEDPPPQPDAEFPASYIAPAPPYQSVVFTADVAGTIADLASTPTSLVMEMVDGELSVVEACGDIAQEASGTTLVTSLLSSLDERLVGVAVVTETVPGQLRIDAYLMLQGAANEDIPVESTNQPEPDAEQPGGV